MENNDKFRIKYTSKESSFKEIDEEDTKDNKNDSKRKSESKSKTTKLPEWSIEPPLEIKRGK